MTGSTPLDERPLSVVLVGTFPPTECGIATHTANLHCALEDVGIRTSVIRLLDPDDDAGPPNDLVAAIWRRGLPSGLQTALTATEQADVVIVQHEYGIYPGPDGDQVIEFVEQCVRPVVTVLHTVVPDPTIRQSAVIDALATCSSLLVVHTESARTRLVETHRLDPLKVVVVPHGASPNLRGSPLIRSREPLLLTWGLLGPGKGVEYGIEAIALLREDGLDVRYVIAGQTHPNVVLRDGESYRIGVKALATDLGVADLIGFDDLYRDWDSLHALVRSADVVLVPYDSHDQVTSGVLVEALAAGKPVVATAFPHAVELESTGAVEVVANKSSEQIANAVRRILISPELRERMAASARAEAERYNWSSVGQLFRSYLLEIVGSGVTLGNGSDRL